MPWRAEGVSRTPVKGGPQEAAKGRKTKESSEKNVGTGRIERNRERRTIENSSSGWNFM